MSGRQYCAVAVWVNYEWGYCYSHFYHLLSLKENLESFLNPVSLRLGVNHEDTGSAGHFGGANSPFNLELRVI